MWNAVCNLRGDNAMEFAALAIAAVEEISADEDAADIFKKRAFEKTENREAEAERVLRRSITALLKNHKDTMLELLACNQGLTVEEYTEKNDPLAVSADISRMVMDPWFRAFFAFAQTTPIQHGSAQERIAARKESNSSPDSWLQKLWRSVTGKR